MTLLRSCKTLLVALAFTGTVLPLRPVLGETPEVNGPVAGVEATQAVRDVALGPGGILRGTVVDPQGQSFRAVPVVVRQASREVARVQTDETGRFQIRGLRGGLYRIESSGSLIVCRLWTAVAAPPAARRELLLVGGGAAERGQMPLGDLFVSKPFLVGMIIAAAIAIPIAVNNSRSGT